MDGQYPRSKLPDPQGALSKHVPSSAILRQTAKRCTSAICRGREGQGSIPENEREEAEIGRRAAEHGVLATIRY